MCPGASGRAACHLLPRRQDVASAAANRLNGPASVAASVRRKVDELTIARQVLPPIRLPRVALPVLPDGHSVAPVTEDRAHLARAQARRRWTRGLSPNRGVGGC